MTNSTLSGNHGESGGGGIYNDSGTVNLTNTTFTNEAPGGNGGALYNLNGTMNVTNSTFWENTTSNVDFDSGGIYNDGTR